MINTRLLAALALVLAVGCSQPRPPDDPADTTPAKHTEAGASDDAIMAEFIASFDAPEQAVTPFWIFDNVGYIGLDWVAAYVIRTSEGLIVIDSLYGKWIPTLLDNMHTLGLDPADTRYVLITHAHFDHAGGALRLQQLSGARIVMSEPDWLLAEATPIDSPLGFDVPPRDIIGGDGDVPTLGDTRITLLRTPGHTPGVLSFVYDVYDGNRKHTAITLGGVGLNFSGVPQTEAYIASYERLLTLAADISVSLPNHASMGAVFEKAALRAGREDGTPHPFVDAPGYADALVTFLARAREKLAAEKAGTARDPMEELRAVLGEP